MSNIFISYNRKNRSLADALAKDFRALGHVAWLDEELSGGQRWWDEILSRIQKCEVFVFVLDRESLTSVACTSEYGYANALGKPILPIRVSPDVSDSSLPEALSVLQYVDYSEQDRNAAFRLARALGGIDPPPPLPDPLPPSPEVPLSYLGKLAPLVMSATELTRAQQADLVFQLKNGLTDPDTVQETRELLQQLRRRQDLYARVAKDIDDLLEDPGSRQTTKLHVTQPKGPVTPPTSDPKGHQPRGTDGPPPGIVREPPRSPGPPPNSPPPQIPNHLVWAILTVICCWPLAIVAIINASQVNGRIAAGDYAGAMSKSKNALTFSIIAAIVGAIGWAVYFIFSFLMAAAQQSNSGF
jgi:hypothetical protein